jgi:mono/diheme cytochrome c family protein
MPWNIFKSRAVARARIDVRRIPKTGNQHLLSGGGFASLGRSALCAVGAAMLFVAVGGDVADARTPAPKPPRVSRASGRDGGLLYATHCARCHGTTGRGDGRDAELFVTPPCDLRSGFVRGHSTAELVARVRDGLRLNLAVDPAAVRARAADTEAIARHIERLSYVNWRLAERGEELFVDRCEICHGPFGRPSGPRPAGVETPRDLSASEFQDRVRDDDIARTIREGHGSMPGLVPRLEVADVPAVVTFVRLLSPGYERYSRYCAACHGDDGRGPGVRYGDDGARAPTVVLDRAYLEHHDFERIRAAVWHMLDEQRPEMPHVRATLSAGDAQAIVEYLKRVDERTR